MHSLSLAFGQHLRNAIYLGMGLAGLGLTVARRRAVTDAATAALRILMYHRVSPRRVDPYTISPRRLARHLDLVRRRCNPITPADLLRAITERAPLPERAVLLTFDDSLREHYDHAWPLLRERGLEAMLFIPTDFVVEPGADRTSSPDGYGEGLDWDQLREMRDVFTIGSHSQSHQEMTSLSRDAAEAEIRRSKEILEEKLDTPVWGFAYPFGSVGTFDDELESMIRSAGYAASFVTLTGPNPQSRLWSGGALRRQSAEPLSTLALGRVLDGSCDAVQAARHRLRAGAATG